jgi:hypothetical protein
MVFAIIGGSVVVFLLLGLVVGIRFRRILGEDDVTAPWRGLGQWQQVPPGSDAERSFRDSLAGHALGMAHRGQTYSGEHRGFRAAAFEWVWHEWSVQQPRRSYRTVVSIALPVARPRLEIRRATVVSGLRADFQVGWERFDQEFFVDTENAAFAKDVLTPEMTEWLLADPRSRYFPIQAAGTAVSTWYSGRLHVGDLGAPTDFLVEFLSRVPARVWAH